MTPNHDQGQDQNTGGTRPKSFELFELGKDPSRQSRIRYELRDALPHATDNHSLMLGKRKRGQALKQTQFDQLQIPLLTRKNLAAFENHIAPVIASVLKYYPSPFEVMSYQQSPSSQKKPAPTGTKSTDLTMATPLSTRSPTPYASAFQSQITWVLRE
ncbi:MAG: hypothetical protein Q9186_006747 [Xanthomendoza sp. 1 TL-2023]